MKPQPCRFSRLTPFAFALLSVSCLRADDPASYKPELFEKTELVYEETFDGELDPEHWEVRQGSTWEIENGVLVGSESPKEFQEKKIAAGDKAHAGFKPVIWLKQVPAEFVCTMRVRYDGEDYIRNFPLIDLGHHVHTLTFSENKTTLKIKKDVEIVDVDAPLFPINEWHDVAIELKKGKLLFTVDGKKHLFESKNIDMGDQRQIDFKGINFGKCRIDDVRIWRGMRARRIAMWDLRSSAAQIHEGMKSVGNPQSGNVRPNEAVSGVRISRCMQHPQRAERQERLEDLHEVTPRIHD